ncbi:MAG: hypothetical protein ABEJ73_11325 [Haloplanus sp.]
MSDRSLDEFVTEMGSGEAADAEGSAGVETPDSNTEMPASDPDPATPTMRWSVDGAACDACGATVARRWREEASEQRHSSDHGTQSGATFVCADCKEW